MTNEKAAKKADKLMILRDINQKDIDIISAQMIDLARIKAQREAVVKELNNRIFKLAKQAA